MTLIIPVGHYHCKLRWRLTGDPEEMVSTLAVTAQGGGERDIVDVAHAVFNAWAGAFEPQTLSSQYTLVGCTVAEGTESGEAGQVASWDEAIPGTATQAVVPSNCALLCKKTSAKSGRANTGRMFVPGGYLVESGVGATGELNGFDYGTIQGYLTQFYDNLRDATTAVGQPIADFLPVILHSILTESPTPIISFVLDRIIATQRQRMRR